MAEQDCSFYYLSRNDFENISMKEFPHIIEKMKVIARKRYKIDKKAVQEIASILQANSKDLSQDHLMTESLKYVNSRKSLESPPLKKDSFHYKSNKIVPITSENPEKNAENEIVKAIFNEKAVSFIKEIKECSQEDISEEDDNENLQNPTNSSPNSQSSENDNEIRRSKSEISENFSNMKNLLQLTEKLKENEKRQEALERKLFGFHEEIQGLLNISQNP